MRLQNLIDAGGLIPQWASATLLNVVFISLYLTAFYTYDATPSSLVASACTVAILLSLVVATILLVQRIVNAKKGEVAHEAAKGVLSGLNLTWAVSCLAFLCLIGFNPIVHLALQHSAQVVSAVIALAIIGCGYFIVAPAKRTTGTISATEHSLAVMPGLKPTAAQQPTFQVTIADLTRLLTHQAGRAIGYAGSNILFDDAFSLELDVNDRVARVYSNTNLINTEDFLYWRLHMLMIGSAAEHVLTGRSSQAALDDLTSFDSLASNYLTLGMDRTFNAAPINVHEASIKAARIGMLRKSVFDRCHAACIGNKAVLVELVKLMRTRSVLTYGDIRVQLARVVMPEGFPIAHFDDGEILNKALLSYYAPEEVTVESAIGDERREHIEQPQQAKEPAKAPIGQPPYSTISA